jgi:hypothetical protein
MMSMAEIVPIVGREVTETTKSLRQAVGLTLSDGWQILIGDKVQAWRLERAAEISTKLSKKLESRGLVAKFDRIPERFAYTWFEKATQEDESDIQELFAELMANAISGDERASDRRSVELVSRLTPEDAKLLNYLAKKFYAKPKFGNPTYQIDLEILDRDIVREGFATSERALDSLLSLGIIRLIPEISVDQSRYERSLARRLDRVPAGSLRDAIGVKSYLYLTDLGRMVTGALGLDKMIDIASE